MRQIVLDTETTGLNPNSGDRIVEIGLVELLNRRLSGRTWHQYLNPERESAEGALAVHGLTSEFLADKPKFAQVAHEMLEFVAGAEIIIHNATFDLGFLNAELKKVNGLNGSARFQDHVSGVLDSLLLARELHPGKRNSLDALCERYGVSNSHRTLHGALLDAQLLADVYLGMTRGQESLIGEMAEAKPATALETAQNQASNQHIIILSADENELGAHQNYLRNLEKQIKRPSVWST